MTIIASDRLGALARVAALLRGSRPTRTTLRAVLAEMPELIPADGYAIWRYDARPGEWHILASAGLSRDYVSHTIAELHDPSVLGDGPFAVDDVMAWPLVAERREFYEAEGVRALYVLPLHFGGVASGTLACYFRERRDIDAEEAKIAHVLADVVAAALATKRFDRLAETARTVSAELDLHRLVNAVTDAATELTNAQFGAFFYNVVDAEGESYTLYTIAGVPREAFERFPMPRNTAVFEPTFSGTGAVRSADIRRDPRYGHNAPYFGMPPGHLPVVSYLAVPVISRSGEVLGGLFFGHHEEGVFTENEEQIVVALAAQAAIGIDNARLYEAMVRSEARYKALALAASSRQTIWSASPGRPLDWMERLHPDERARAAETWEHAAEAHEPFREEYRIHRDAGAYGWCDVRGVPVLRPDGTVAEWVGTLTDIDDERTANEHLRFLAEASDLLASSLEYETTLKTVTQLAVRSIADWCAVDISEEDGSYHRISVAHVDPEKVELAMELERRYPPKADVSVVARVIRSGKTEWMDDVPPALVDASAVDDEHRGLLQQLGLRSFIVVPLLAHGRVFGAMTFVLSFESGRRFGPTDVRLAEELARRGAVAIENARLYGAANAANRAKDEFLATLSHELRTPMTAVVGWARMLKMGLTPDESADAVDAIEKSASVQMQLIEDILDMSRIMAGKLRIQSATVDMRGVVESALTTVRPAAENKGVEIISSFAAVIPQVSGDGYRLQQVVWNLLTNAVKFTSRGGTILVRLSPGDDGVCLTVRDSGIGIDPEFLPHVFERFRQADSSTTRAHGGIGIGLTIVRYLVEMHGGTIAAESEGVGRGSTFRVTLPAMDARTRAVIPPAARDLPPLDDVSILVIDDEPMTRDVVAAILRMCHADVTTADSAEDARRRLAERVPNVIVCDIAMPVEDGYAFVGTLRESGTRIPVIALTAFGRREDRERALAAGFDAFLVKPVDPTTLATTVR
ncbi:MAG TPA: GAF domain-containing protein, partial [Thermoanaerobaculia bacterium]|nr:GAF domain-containing protein [Thermoanaerobaculia bacterium]